MEFFKYRNGFSIILSLLVVLYCVYSIGMLWVTIVVKQAGIDMGLPAKINAKQDFLMLHFVASYVLVLLVTTYHLYTFIRRRKRKNDKPGEAPAPKPVEV